MEEAAALEVILKEGILILVPKYAQTSLAPRVSLGYPLATVIWAGDPSRCLSRGWMGGGLTSRGVVVT